MADEKKNTNDLVKTEKLKSSVITLPAPAEPAPTSPIQVLPVVPIREGILFPSTESVLTFGRPISLNALHDVTEKNNLVVLVTQKKPSVEAPQPADLYQFGTLAAIERKIKTGKSVNALVKGMGRVKIVQYTLADNKIIAVVETCPDVEEKSEELTAMVNHLQKIFRQAVHMGKPVEFLSFMKLMSGVTNGELTDQIASTLNITTPEKQQILETINVKERVRIVIEALTHEMKIMEIEKDVVNKTQKKFDKNMRENILRERLRTIQKELGELDDEEEVIDEYTNKLKKIKLPTEIKTKVTKEIRRLKQMSPNNPESGYVRTWLDTVFDLPWGKFDQTTVNLKQAEKVLAKSHYGLEEVKDRVIEYIAVLQLKQKNFTAKKDQKLPTILCFVGPPGVGKTSIGRSIAASLKRKFVKISLGGIRDEAEIRGHRRTYVGAMPGRIISGIKQAGSMNPVFMLDEIDKLGADFRGDPSSALLEALDPEQNHTFEDHYLDMAFDLSEVIFITTANTLDTIPAALRDRLEVIRYSGYTEEEKFHIAQDHLVEKVIKANGLLSKQITFANESLKYIIARFTREAGVRDLERNLHKIARKIAKKLVSGTQKNGNLKISSKLIRELLGPEIFDIENTEAQDTVGQATGLAWTSVGGDTLFIEVALTPGKGEVKLTGKLGDVMKESAQTALTFVKANASNYAINPKLMQETNVHIHVPEGAVPKDGPSAGVTIVTAIVSAFTNIPVKHEVAMTGEVTLRGRVLRIGGLKEKSIAAARAGSKLILIPQTNERDLEKIPNSVKKSVKFIPVAHVDQVLAQALTKIPKKFRLQQPTKK
ncbi:MAG TPA: endopeptidase La [Candidatus Woesebacteria bacterium]|nr:endopeptidase La [Candidatus Woesebacteria bacterium]